MLRRFSLIAAIVTALTLFVSSCSHDHGQDETISAQNAILIFMPWSGSETSKGLYYNLQKNLSDIESAIVADNGLGTTQVFVCLANSHTETWLYEITYENAACSHKTIASYNSKDCATANGISAIINDVKKHTQAPQLSMIIGCHGSGWTSKSDWQNYPYKAKPWKNLYSGNTNTTYPLTRFFGSVNDMDYAIDITALAEGIAATDTKMQYILFDNCYMANIETAYELKEATNYIIASTSEIFAIGMPYEKMWKYLAQPITDYKQIVDTYYDFYTSYEDPCGTLSTIDCSALDNLAQTMRQINSTYTFDHAQTDNLQILGGFEPTLFYDLGDYVDKLCNDETLKNQFNRQLQKVVIYSKSTEQILTYLYSKKRYIDINHFSGITTSAPSTNPVALKGLPQTKWTIDTTPHD